MGNGSLAGLKPPDGSANEQARIKVLRQYAVLDTEPEDDLDSLATLAAHICGAPISLISLVDVDRQWFKARVGLEVKETPRSDSFCAHALDQTGLLIVPDALEDERFLRNPLVTGEPGIRFYAGAPLITPDNTVLGTLCVIDRVPRQISETQELVLQMLARKVIQKFERRRRRAELGLAIDGELSAGIHVYTLEQFQSLVCTSTLRYARWLRLVGFLAQPILSQQFSHAYISGEILTTKDSPDRATVTLQTRAPYGPQTIALLKDYLETDRQRLMDLFSIHLRFWMENSPPAVFGQDPFFRSVMPWQSAEGQPIPVVRLSLADGDIVTQFQRAMDPFESWKVPSSAELAAGYRPQPVI